MECPYCKKYKCEPPMIYKHIETYGDSWSNFKCIHCEKVISVHGERRVVFGKPEKTDAESDWSDY